MEKKEVKNLDVTTMLGCAVPIVIMETLSERLFPNLFDKNSNKTKKRTLILKIDFIPTLDRDGDVDGCDIIVNDPEVKLSPRNPVKGHVLLGEVDGQYQAKEVYDRQTKITDPVEEDFSHGSGPLKAVR